MQLIAECGVNWHTMEDAFEMIRQSKLAHASYTKFQLFNEETIKYTPLKKELTPLILTKENVQELYEYGKEIEQSVFFSCMFEKSVDWCEEIGVDIYKIRYSDRYNYDLICKVLATHKEVLMSIDLDYRAMEFNHNHRIKFLYVVPEYPAQLKSYKLNRSIFKYFSGISDHTPNLELARKALKLNGNIIIEKHVKLDDNCIEKDWSVTFDELRSLLGGEDEK